MADHVQLELAPNGRGSFFIVRNEQKIAEMVVAVREDHITVFHTEVMDGLQGQGVGARLLQVMVQYARDQNKKIIPLCVYVRQQFDKSPEVYADVWKRDWH